MTFNAFHSLSGSTSAYRKWCSHVRTRSGRRFTRRTEFVLTSSNKRCSTMSSTSVRRNWTCTRSCHSLKPDPIVCLLSLFPSCDNILHQLELLRFIKRHHFLSFYVITRHEKLLVDFFGLYWISLINYFLVNSLKVLP